MPQLLAEIAVLDTRGDPSTIDVQAIEHDSRRVRPGTWFCCLPGDRVDGHVFADEAVDRGAVALLVERPLELRATRPVVQVQVPVGGARTAMARLAAALHGFPAEELLMAGVTGTNGKTTVTQLLGAVLEHAGYPTGVIGTLSGTRTTPESTELQALLAEQRDQGRAEGRTHAVAMEVSSHALAQSRVDGMRFDVAVFTNLSHDHLDFHGTMERYFEAKATLFTPERTVRAVINADDPWGRRLLARAEVPTVAVRRQDIEIDRLAIGRSSFRWRGETVEVPLTGAVNVANAHVAAEAAVALGVDPSVVVAGLATAPQVPGRLEHVTVSGGGPTPVDVLVDYAHTPAGLEVVLSDARAFSAGGRLLVVMGCGGDRDAAKRPLMGQVVSRLADRVVVTSDNPRSEDPLAIIEAVVSGVDPAARAAGVVRVEPDRRTAIVSAIAEAQPGDLVVVAGKGHERYQEIDGRQLPFDDREVARAALDDRAHGVG